jgi:ATP-dependent Clp protease adaptor protein ClpS
MPKERTRTGNETMRELPGNVILHNDWDNSMPRVVIILKKVIPGMTLAKGTANMYEVHN